MALVNFGVALTMSLSMMLSYISFIQTVALSEADWLGRAEQLSLKVALVVAVYILWRALVRKDEALAVMTENVTKALDLSAASNVELRKIIDESVRTKEALRQSIDILSNNLKGVPCVLGDTHLPHREDYKR